MQYLVDSLDAVFDKIVADREKYFLFEIWETNRDHAKRRCWAQKTRQIIKDTDKRVFPDGIMGAKVKTQKEIKLDELSKIIYYQHITGRFYIIRFLKKY